MTRNYHLRVELRTTNDRIGIQWLTDDGQMIWSHGGDDETVSATFSQFDPDFTRCVQSFEIGGDDWRDIENENSIDQVVFWMDRGVGLVDAVNAAIANCDPDGFNMCDEVEKDRLKEQLADANETIDNLRAASAADQTLIARQQKLIQEVLGRLVEIDQRLSKIEAKPAFYLS